MKKANVKTAKSAKKNSPFSLVEKSDYLYYKVFCLLLFIVLACYYTFIHNASLLYKLQELSLFMSGGMFFHECMELPGGLLAYAGAFLTQFFYYPWLGSFFFIILLLLVVFLLVRAFKISDKFFPLAVIPACMFLLALTSLDYVIFIMKSTGYIFSNILGIIVLLLCFWIYRKISSLYVRAAGLVVIVVGGYPLFGFYALLTSLIIIAFEVGCYLRDKRVLHFLPCIVAVLSMVVVPYLYSLFFYSRLSVEEIYKAGLPLFYFNKMEFAYWISYLVIFLLLICFVGFLFRQPKKENFTSSAILVFFIYLLSFAGLYSGSNENENFRTELAMDLATFENEWEQVVAISEKNTHEPSRLIVLFRNLALQKMGIAGDNLFRYPHASAPNVARRPSIYLRNIGSMPIYYQYGQINNCYRWSMEDHVEYGSKVIYLKYMTKCALLNGEYQLAAKYNNALKKTLFHKEWADKYQQYIDNPELMKEDAEFTAIRPLMAFENLLAGDAGLLENFILNSFAYMVGGNREISEISLQNNMIQKNIDRFWPRFALYERNHDRLPVHYQEAALLFSFLERKVDVSNIEFDPQVEKMFDEFIRTSQQYANYSEEQMKEIFKPRFGKTYWYYYFFIKGLKTN